MTEWGVYWPNFKSEREYWPVESWQIGAGSPLAKVSRGDRLWLFTAGDLCDMPEKKQAYLVQLMIVERMENDPDDVGCFRIYGRDGS